MEVRIRYKLKSARPFPEEDPPAENNNTRLKPRQEGLYHRSARIIQRTWRRHMDIHVFKYFKNLVRFRNQGDPRLILKSVNPREAELLDAAAGVYIRFRLGGTTFPPNIYYKIFTHRPIVDMCSNSPKDYTHPSQKRPVPRQIHNKRPLVPGDRSGWYRRTENNGWRVFSGKFTDSNVFTDTITLDTSSKKVEFHHCKLQRQQDVAMRKKRRKIDWLKHMYDQGRLDARTENRQAAALVDRSAQGMMEEIEQLGPNLVEEWEVDELLEWTNALNIDKYMSEWMDVGTSSSSCKAVDKRLVLSKLYPCESSGLGQEDSQMGTYRCIHPLVSSLTKSEHSTANISDWNLATTNQPS